jgi:hypothetical protein
MEACQENPAAITSAWSIRLMADSSGKLYYLRDRARRSAPRQSRRRPEGTGTSEADRHPPISKEALWLSRVLFAGAAYLVLYWLGVAAGVVAVPEVTESRLWLYSFVPGDLLVAGVSGVAAWDLLRGPGRRDFFLVLAAGGLMFLSLSRLTQGITASFVAELTPGQRLHVTLMGVCLYVGLWAASYALRTRRGGE